MTDHTSITCKHRDRVIVETESGETVEISVYKVRKWEIRLKAESENVILRPNASDSSDLDSKDGGRDNVNATRSV